MMLTSALSNFQRIKLEDGKLSLVFRDDLDGYEHMSTYDTGIVEALSEHFETVIAEVRGPARANIKLMADKTLEFLNPLKKKEDFSNLSVKRMGLIPGFDTILSIANSNEIPQTSFTEMKFTIEADNKNGLEYNAKENILNPLLHKLPDDLVEFINSMDSADVDDILKTYILPQSEEALRFKNVCLKTKEVNSSNVDLYLLHDASIAFLLALSLLNGDANVKLHGFRDKYYIRTNLEAILHILKSCISLYGTKIETDINNGILIVYDVNAYDIMSEKVLDLEIDKTAFVYAETYNKFLLNSNNFAEAIFYEAYLLRRDTDNKTINDSDLKLRASLDYISSEMEALVNGWEAFVREKETLIRNYNGNIMVAGMRDVFIRDILPLYREQLEEKMVVNERALALKADTIIEEYSFNEIEDNLYVVSERLVLELIYHELNKEVVSFFSYFKECSEEDKNTCATYATVQMITDWVVKNMAII